MFRCFGIVAFFSVASLVLGASFADTDDAGLVIEGSVIERSPLSEAAVAGQENCLYSAEIELSPDSSIPDMPETRRIVVLLSGASGYKATPENAYANGDKLRIEVNKYTPVTPEEKQAFQIQDTVGRFRLPYFVVVKSEKITVFSDKPTKTPERKEPAIDWGEPLNPPQSPASRKARTEAIEAEKQRISKRLEDVASAIAAAGSMVDDYAAALTKTTRTTMRGINMFYFKRGAGYFCVPEKPVDILRNYQYSQEPINAIAALNMYLAHHNVDLIVVMEPGGIDIATRMLLPDGGKYPFVGAMNFARELLNRDIEVIDMSDRLLAAADKYEWLYSYYRPLDCQPASGVEAETSSAIAERLARYSEITPRLNKWQFTTGPGAAKMSFGWPINIDEKHKGDDVIVPIIKFDRRNVMPPELMESPRSPVLLMGGENYIDNPYKYAVALHIAQKIGEFPCEMVFPRFNMPVAAPGVLLNNNGEAIRHRRAVVLCIAAEEAAYANWNHVEKMHQQYEVGKSLTLVKSLNARQVALGFSTKLYLMDYHVNYIKQVAEYEKAAWFTGIHNTTYTCGIKLPSRVEPGDLLVLDMFSQFMVSIEVEGEQHLLNGGRDSLYFTLKKIPVNRRVNISLTPQNNVAICGIFSVGLYRKQGTDKK
ncbi:MAG: hypothetical protein PHI35_05145 [Victivallaceae bacterium]|nr:hypothetical protein [Victivallaceae bacterium]